MIPIDFYFKKFTKTKFRLHEVKVAHWSYQN